MNITTSNRRLLKLAAFLARLPRQKFSYNFCVKERDKNGCGTVGCAIGWTPKVFPRLVSWHNKSLNAWGYTSIAKHLFGLNTDQIDHLFTPGINNPLGDRATPRMVSAHIRRFVKNNQVIA